MKAPGSASSGSWWTVTSQPAAKVSATVVATPVTSVSAIACLSEHGRLLVFGLDEIKTLASGGGACQSSAP